MNPLIAVVTAVLLLGSQHPQMPAGMSHEEHLKQLQKEADLRTRGGEAMGFDQDATTHHFKLTPTGGSIEVTVNRSGDDKNLAAVRAHLRSIADEFARGQFDRPFQTHGEVPPGVRTMQARIASITFRYQDLAQGGAVRIETTDAELLDAVHAFLRYQIVEHHTGDPVDGVGSSSGK